jgi:Domain of unknown function (DUF1844)
MPEEKKIIIDEDWKSQVQAEKEAEKRSQPEAPDVAAAAGEPDDPPMPPASLELLVSSLVTEALIALGQVPHPATGKASLRRHQAKYLIDTIEMLHQKTKGNVTPEEERFFEQLLHQLRMAFVSLTMPGAADTSVG